MQIFPRFELVRSFFRTGLVLLLFGENTTELWCPHYLSLGEMQFQHNFPLVMLLKVMSAKILPQSYFSSLYLVYSVELNHHSTGHTRGKEDYSPPPGGGSVYIYYLEFFCKEDLFYSFIHSINDFLIVLWDCTCLFYSLSLIQYYYYSNCSSFGHWEFL